MSLRLPKRAVLTALVTLSVAAWPALAGPATTPIEHVVIIFQENVSFDHSLTDQSSLLRFIEDNWSLGQLENSSDAVAGLVNGMFDFEHARSDRVILDPETGEVRDGEGENE